MSHSKLILVALACMACALILPGCGEQTTEPEKMVQDIQKQNQPQQEIPEHLKNRGFSGSRGSGAK